MLCYTSSALPTSQGANVTHLHVCNGKHTSSPGADTFDPDVTHHVGQKGTQGLPVHKATW